MILIRYGSEGIYGALVRVVWAPHAYGQAKRISPASIVRGIDEILVQEQKGPIDGILVMDHPVAGLVIGIGVYAFRK